jgi:hypothetical protein
LFQKKGNYNLIKHILALRLALVHLVANILEIGLRIYLVISKLIHKPKYSEFGLVTSHYLNTDPEIMSAIDAAKKSTGNNLYPLWKAVIYLYFVRHTEKIPGDYVELGVGKGFNTCATLHYQSGTNNRRYLLFDKFDPGVVDQDTGLILEGKFNSDYSLNLEEVKNNLSKYSADIVFCKGHLPQSIDLNLINNISFLHIDLNAALPETASLKLLWQIISPGGIIILDDYAQEGRKNQFDAMNKLSKEFNFSILSLPTGQGLIIK